MRLCGGRLRFMHRLNSCILLVWHAFITRMRTSVMCVVPHAQVYVTLISILKAGAAYVPIDPAYPADRVSYIMGDARCPVMLTSMALPIFHDIFVQHNQYVVV
jgi:non-ribosomal peptide synthetase component F